MDTLTTQGNGNMVIGTLAIDEWAVTFGTRRKGLLGGLQPTAYYSMLHSKWLNDNQTRQIVVCQAVNYDRQYNDQLQSRRNIQGLL